VDRGPDTIAIYNLFDKLRKQAKEAGGLVKKIGNKILSCKSFSFLEVGSQNSTFLFFPSFA